MSATAVSVVRMANDIARNFAANGDEAAAQQTAEHIQLFWDPRMKAKAFDLLHEQDCGLSEVARAALLSIMA